MEAHLSTNPASVLSDNVAIPRVFLDDLEIKPVPKDLLTRPSKPESSGPSTKMPRFEGNIKEESLAAGKVRLDRYILERLGDDRRFHGWIPTAIDAPGSSVVKLRQAGMDVFIDELNSYPERLKSAVDRGFLLMPRLSGATDPAGEGLAIWRNR